MGFLIKILLLCAILAGGGYYLVRDVPLAKAALDDLLPFNKEAPHALVQDIFARKVEKARDNGEPTEAAFLLRYYESALDAKHAAMLSQGDGKLTAKLYLRIKQQEYSNHLAATKDKDKSGQVERAEWPDDQVFKLSTLDRDNDKTLTYEELWAGARGASIAAFKAADKNGDNHLTLEEYKGYIESEGHAAKNSELLDSNRNGAVSATELQVYTTVGRRNNWQP